MKNKIVIFFSLSLFALSGCGALVPEEIKAINEQIMLDAEEFEKQEERLDQDEIDQAIKEEEALSRNRISLPLSMSEVTEFIESHQGFIQMDSPATFESELFANEDRSLYVSYHSANETGDVTDFFIATEDLDFKTNEQLYPYMFDLLVEFLSLMDVEMDSNAIEQLTDTAIEQREILYEELENEIILELRPNINTDTDEIFSIQLVIYQKHDNI